jgi:hypothetical protein
MDCGGNRYKYPANAKARGSLGLHLLVNLAQISPAKARQILALWRRFETAREEKWIQLRRK